MHSNQVTLRNNLKYIQNWRGLPWRSSCVPDTNYQTKSLKKSKYTGLETQ